MKTRGRAGRRDATTVDLGGCESGRASADERATAASVTVATRPTAASVTVVPEQRWRRQRSVRGGGPGGRADGPGGRADLPVGRTRRLSTTVGAGTAGRLRVDG